MRDCNKIHFTKLTNKSKTKNIEKHLRYNEKCNQCHESQLVAQKIEYLIILLYHHHQFKF